MRTLPHLQGDHWFRWPVRHNRQRSHSKLRSSHRSAHYGKSYMPPSAVGTWVPQVTFVRISAFRSPGRRVGRRKTKGRPEYTETPKRPPVFRSAKRGESDGRPLHWKPPQHVVVNLLDHLDIDYPSVADRQDQSTEPLGLQACEDVEHKHYFSVADTVRQAHQRVQPVDSHGFLRPPLSRTTDTQ